MKRAKAHHIDTDMGVDDGLALTVASRVMNICSVSTVFGNIPVNVATRNAFIFRNLLDAESKWNIIEGAQRASDGFYRGAEDVHGSDGLGGATKYLSRDFIEKCDHGKTTSLESFSCPKPELITLIGLGPATNIPHLVKKFGKKNIDKIVLMSGSFFDSGNITPHSEFNSYCDPYALIEVLNLGIPVTMVPLDVCRKIQIYREHINQRKSLHQSVLSNLIVNSHNFYMNFYKKWEGIDGFFPHDTIAVLVALAPDRFYSVRGIVNVNCKRDYRGQTSMQISKRGGVDVIMGGDLKWARDIINNIITDESFCHSE